MSDEPAPGDGQTEIPAKPTFVDRVIASASWAITSVGAVGVFAVGNLGLSDVSGGSFDGSEWWVLLLSVTLFVSGVVGLVASTMWVTRSSRVTLFELVEACPATSEARASKWVRFRRRTNALSSVAEMINGSPHLSNGLSLRDFKSRFSEDVLTRSTSTNWTAQAEDDFQLMVKARDSMLATAGAQRTAKVASRSVWVFAVAALATALGATWFVAVTGEAKVRRDQELETVEKRQAVIPVAMSVVALAPPDDVAEEVAKSLGLVGDDCDVSAIRFVVLELADRAQTAEPMRIVHVASAATADCTSGDGWVEPAWLVEPPEDADDHGDAPPTTPPETTPPETTPPETTPPSAP